VFSTLSSCAWLVSTATQELSARAAESASWESHVRIGAGLPPDRLDGANGEDRERKNEYNWEVDHC
jgi:hypothetical protein